MSDSYLITNFVICCINKNCCRFYWLFTFLFTLALLLGACVPSTTVATVEPARTPSSNKSEDSISENQTETNITETPEDQLRDVVFAQWELWEDLNIQNYEFSFTFRSDWIYYDAYTKVENNEIVELNIDCLEGPESHDICESMTSDMSPESFTINGQFSSIISSLNWLDFSYSSWDEFASISFDSQYHYPIYYRFDEPNASGEKHIIEVLDFVILDN